MDTIFRISLLAIIALISALTVVKAQEDKLTVRFENATAVDALEGASLNFRCHINRNAMFVINNIIQIVHIHPITKKETVMSKAGNLVEGKPEFYDVTVEPGIGDDLVILFTIKKVRYDDDGMFKCHAVANDESADVTKAVTVHRPMSALILQVPPFDMVNEVIKTPVAIDAGTYPVECTVEGSNPATEKVNLFLDGVKFAKVNMTSEVMEDPFRMFRTTVTASLDIMMKDTTHDVTCQAEDSTGQSKSAGISLKVNVYDPVVSCNDTEAFVGQANPVLSCTVNHTGLEITGYSFQIGQSGEIFKQGVEHSKNVQVMVNDVSDGVSIVSLDLHKAEAHYLGENYYILIDIKGGHTSKESVRLNKVDAPNKGYEIEENKNPTDSGVNVVPATFVCLTTMMAAIFSWTL